MRKGVKRFIITIIVLLLLAGAGLAAYLLRDKWLPSNTVTFDADGGVCEVQTVQVQKNKGVELPNAEKEGYNFDGWYYGEEK